jgi:hypothetical protein
MGEREEVAARLHFLINLDSFFGIKTAPRWIFFIPAGLIAGSLVSSLFQLFVWIGSWWWGGQDGALLVFVNFYTLTYFRIICMAWVAPPALKVSTFKIIASLGFGLHFQPCERCSLAVPPAEKASPSDRSPLIRSKHPTSPCEPQRRHHGRFYGYTPTFRR